MMRGRSNPGDSRILRRTQLPLYDKQVALIQRDRKCDKVRNCSRGERNLVKELRIFTSKIEQMYSLTSF